MFCADKQSSFSPFVYWDLIVGTNVVKHHLKNESDGVCFVSRLLVIYKPDKLGGACSISNETIE